MTIPDFQLCTDCRTRRRALAEGKPGYGCLCVECFTARMDEARNKAKRSRPTPSGKPADLHGQALREVLDMEKYPEALSPLDSLDEL